MVANRHSPINFESRVFLLVWCLLGGLALLPIPALSALSVELLYLELARPSPDRSGLTVRAYALFSMLAMPLIPLFLAWSLPGARSHGVPKRSIGALCLLIAYHPLRLYFGQYAYRPSIAEAVAEIQKQFPYLWVLRHLDTPVLIGLTTYAIFWCRTAQPKEKILFHWGLFACALWAAGPFCDDYFSFLLSYY